MCKTNELLKEFFCFCFNFFWNGPDSKGGREREAGASSVVRTQLWTLPLTDKNLTWLVKWEEQ